MVIASGTLKNIREAKEYNKKVVELKQIMKNNKIDLSDKAKSLESKLRISGGLSGLFGLIFGTAAFGAPAFGALLYGELNSDESAIASIAYFFGSAIGFCTFGGLNEYYAKKYLDELKKQTSKIPINYNI